MSSAANDRIRAADRASEMQRLREYAQWGGRDSAYQWALDEIERLRNALAPFADPRSWHVNYDGSGIIFQAEGDFYESQIQKRIDLAKEVIRDGGR